MKKAIIIGLMVFCLLTGLWLILKGIKRGREARAPEAFPITGDYQAYFELAGDKTSLALDEYINIEVGLAASQNQDFDAAVALVEWDESKLEFVSATGNLKDKNNNPAQFTSAFVQSDQGRRILVHFVPQGDSLMANSSNSLTLFATLILKAKVDRPETTIKFSSSVDNLAVHFVGADVENSVDQSLANANNLQIDLIASALPAGCLCCQGCTTNQDCRDYQGAECLSYIDEDGTNQTCCMTSSSSSPSVPPWTVPSPSPSPSFSPSPSPSPGSISGITLRVKLDGVPANNNDHCGQDYCNLPDAFRTQIMTVLLEKEADGTDVYEAEVEFHYVGNGIWEGIL